MLGSLPTPAALVRRQVSPGDLVVSEKLRDVDVNDRVKLGRVLMLGSRHETIIGRPLVPNASVTAVIEEQFQDAKVLIFHKRRRKNSRRLKGHRQVGSLFLGMLSADMASLPLLLTSAMLSEMESTSAACCVCRS